MEIRFAEYFLRVVDYGGVTKAAESLYIAQPSLSQAIKSMETQLGVQLFERVGRTLVLTDAGRALVPPARKLLVDVDRARSAVERVKRVTSGTLVIAAPSMLAVEPLTRIAGDFHERYPGIVLSIKDPGEPGDVVASVRRGDAEIGLVDLPVAAEGLEAVEIGEYEIVLAIPPRFTVGLPDPVPVDRIPEIPLIVDLGDTRTYSLLDDAVKSDELNVAVETAHRQTIWKLVDGGVGATFLPRAVAERELSGADIRSTEPRALRRMGVIYRQGAASPAASAFLDLVRVSEYLPRAVPSG
jgi:DNA-binding transcriptional LysR family regulator